MIAWSVADLGHRARQLIRQPFSDLVVEEGYRPTIESVL